MLPAIQLQQEIACPVPENVNCVASSSHVAIGSVRGLKLLACDGDLRETISIDTNEICTALAIANQTILLGSGSTLYQMATTSEVLHPIHRPGHPPDTPITCIVRSVDDTFAVAGGK